MSMARTIIDRINEDTHEATHKILTDHQWELSSVKKTAPLNSTHIYRHPKHPEHELHVSNFGGGMNHYERTKNKDGYAQKNMTYVPWGKVKEYIVQFHKTKDDQPIKKEPLVKKERAK